ncbi:baseplate J/gp47 family protein [Pseudobacteriovorax antillogorgiicola]|uniref:Phage-related baseplate assembly protein n=1 Tax=Pseudobacteriovorax antillogorgiicola TaxID=1513793 RepID=A0A1Y6CUR5_9BACT|nr:baseplate J/gp47 family protein [Pseudobacteriovorax antillogorgiicola]TCS44264.1 phage-related baseplate assembly protein [Pseudobacteriovorax antillogorgiicola]SMF80825.1 Phage-related baseplate assembly protein [Pseudobacteriovorax antillogorgiicola]
MTEPKIYEDLNYEQILGEKLDRLTRAYRREVPDFERPTVVDPIYHAMAEVTLTEIVTRERVNYAALQQLLGFSEELDFILQGKRRDGESDEKFRLRIAADIASASSAGSLAMYEGLAFAAGQLDEVKVLDTKARSENGKVAVYLQVGSDSEELKAKAVTAVSDYLNRKDVKPALDEVEVKLASPLDLKVTATLVLEPFTSISVVSKIKSAFEKALKERARLGWGPSMSWITAKLQGQGVYSVRLSSPTQDIDPEDYQYVSLSSVTLTPEVKQ